MANAYIFYGKAGSGKGTQAHLLMEHMKSLGVATLSAETGGLLRALSAHGGFVAGKIQETMTHGELVPLFMASYVWSHALVTGFTGSEDVILDGVARRLEEASVLDSALSYLGFENVFIFHVHIGDETAVERMRSRATIDAERSGASRPDDTDEGAIRARLEVYRTQVMPVIEYFEQHSNYRLCEINGEESVEGVFDQIRKAIGR